MKQFFTGQHPTTQLCLRFVQDHVKAGNNFLDYGTGSGILSILAAKIGAKKCIAVDIDDESLRAAESNAMLNNCSDVIDVVHTRFVYVGEERFPVCDVTVANILPVSNICRPRCTNYNTDHTSCSIGSAKQAGLSLIIIYQTRRIALSVWPPTKRTSCDPKVRSMNMISFFPD